MKIEMSMEIEMSVEIELVHKGQQHHGSLAQRTPLFAAMSRHMSLTNYCARDFPFEQTF